MSSGEYEELVRAIVEENKYMSLATSDEAGHWVAPVAFVTDDALDLYFRSLPTSQHAQHIEVNPSVVCAIYDSRQPLFNCRGVQITGAAQRLSDDEVPDGIFAQRPLPPDMDVDPNYVPFVVRTDRFWVPRSYLEGSLRDERLEIEMKPVPSR